MGVLSTVLEKFGRHKRASLHDHPAAAGNASDAVGSLIPELRRTQPVEVRDTSTAGYLDAVIGKERLGEWVELLTGFFGEPHKPFGDRPALDRDLRQLVESTGGINKNQCLFVRRFADDHVAYAALWPWSDPKYVTIKVGVYDDPLPARI